MRRKAIPVSVIPPQRADLWIVLRGDTVEQCDCLLIGISEPYLDAQEPEAEYECRGTTQVREYDPIRGRAVIVDPYHPAILGRNAFVTKEEAIGVARKRLEAQKAQVDAKLGSLALLAQA